MYVCCSYYKKKRKVYKLTRLFCVAVSKGEALDALLRDVLEAGHGAGARARERAVQLI